MTILGSLISRVPGTKPDISKQIYKAVKNYNCIRTADSFDFEVVVAETTNTIDFHRSSQLRSVIFQKVGINKSNNAKERKSVRNNHPPGTSGFRSGSTAPRF